MAGSITSLNAVVTITVPNLYPVPQQLQMFAADDIYDYDDIETVETVMGVDQNLAGGLVANKIIQKFYFQANSVSIPFFENIRQQQLIINDVYIMSGSVVLTSIGRKYTCTGGFLTRLSPGASAKKLLQRRVFEITWEKVLAQNASAQAF